MSRKMNGASTLEMYVARLGLRHVHTWRLKGQMQASLRWYTWPAPANRSDSARTVLIHCEGDGSWAEYLSTDLVEPDAIERRTRAMVMADQAFTMIDSLWEFIETPNSDIERHHRFTELHAKVEDLARKAETNHD